MLSWLGERPPDLSWLVRPGGHSFRWRDERGRWWTSARRVSSGRHLARELARHPPRDVYVSTAEWLEPVGLPRLRDPAPPPILLDHLVVFDLDRAPFSLASLERARVDACALVDWLADERDLELVHVAFSGGKGFHVVLRDRDRAAFRIEDRRARELAVRERRAQLLHRALAAGHAVDATVTADTRRIVRLPGTLHGATGWACTIVPLEMLRLPLASWVDQLPRAPGALPIPAQASAPAPREKAPAARAATRGALVLQASSHVVGTPDRGALLAWTSAPAALATERVARAGLGPVAVWSDGARTLLLVPRAVPQPALARAAEAARLRGFGAALLARGHAWVDVAPRRYDDGEEAAPLVPVGVFAAADCAHPWSRPHLDLARRLGQPLDVAGVACGGERARVRVAQIG